MISGKVSILHKCIFTLSSLLPFSLLLLVSSPRLLVSFLRLQVSFLRLLVSFLRLLVSFLLSFPQLWSQPMSLVLAFSLPVLVLLLLILVLQLKLLVILVQASQQVLDLAFIQLVHHAITLLVADIDLLLAVDHNVVLQLASFLARNVAMAEQALVESLPLEPSSFFAF